MQMGTHLKELGKSFPMNTNLTWFKRFSKVFFLVLVFWMKVASALEGLMSMGREFQVNNLFACEQVGIDRLTSFQVSHFEL